MGDALDNVMANNGEAAMAGAAASATATAVANRDAAQECTALRVVYGPCI
jgi:hypothetical protein